MSIQCPVSRTWPLQLGRPSAVTRKDRNIAWNKTFKGPACRGEKRLKSQKRKDKKRGREKEKERKGGSEPARERDRERQRDRERCGIENRKKATTKKQCTYVCLHRQQPGRKRTEAKTKRRNATLKSVHETLETHWGTKQAGKKAATRKEKWYNKG